MAEYSPPNSDQEYDRNFAPIKPLMNGTEAYFESSRCLFCYDAPCVNACPTGIDIPLFIRQINSKNETGAAKTIYDANYFGYACGKVCPTEVLCEGACVYNHQDVKPIEIGRLQSYATGSVIRSNTKLYAAGKENAKKVAVIGAGPAGISCACELRLMGFSVDVFEAKSRPSGLTVHGVAPYKITDKEALDEMRFLQMQFGFNVHYESGIHSMEDIHRLDAEYDAVFLGIGLGPTSDLRINGEDQENCFGAVEFVERLRRDRHTIKVPKSVIVLGGGNTAMDAASECARMGAEKVILAYRRGKDEMGAYEFEYDLAKGTGVEGLFNVSPLEVTGNGKVNGVSFAKTQIVDGNVIVMPGTAFHLEADWVIKATGQSKQRELLASISGLGLDDKGRIICNPEGQTGNQKYFAAGDAVSGGQEVVNAAADGKKAAHAIRRFLSV